MKGLISFEGVEGSGKTTQMEFLRGWLVALGQKTIATREPGGTTLGVNVRAAVLQVRSQALAKETELFLYLADRAQHVRELIKPALARGEVVLCDRFSDSTLAYQGFGRGFPLELLKRLNALCTGDIVPDITFLIDCPAAVGLSRAMKRLHREGSKESRFEMEPMEFHERVREGFLALARDEPRRFVVLDSQGDIDDVKKRVQKVVLERLGE